MALSELDFHKISFCLVTVTQVSILLLTACYLTCTMMFLSLYAKLLFAWLREQNAAELFTPVIN